MGLAVLGQDSEKVSYGSISPTLHDYRIRGSHGCDRMMHDMTSFLSHKLLFSRCLKVGCATKPLFPNYACGAIVAGCAAFGPTSGYK